MLNEVVKTAKLAEGVHEIWVRNKNIAEKFRAGQFVIVYLEDKCERIPLTIADSSDDIIRLVVQIVGYSSDKLCRLKTGDVINDVAGPLGHSTEVKKYGKVAALAGGIGAAPLLPIVRALKSAGNHITVIEGARCRDMLILKDELSSFSDRMIITSDDGSVGEKALVTEPLNRMISEGERPDYVYAVGPAVMMQAVSRITKGNDIPLTVSMNPIMVDGTGMCGSCRVDVSGEVKFACVDGPEFDGNKVDFQLLINRLKMYKNEESFVLEHNPGCGNK